MLRLESLFLIFICNSTVALNRHPTIKTTISLNHVGCEFANTRIYHKTCICYIRHENSRSFPSIFELLKLCDPELLLHVQSVFISLISQQYIRCTSPDFLFSSSFPSKLWSFLLTNSLSYIIRNGPRLSCDASLPPISSKAPICPRRERNLQDCSQFSHHMADAATAHVGPVSSVS